MKIKIVVRPEDAQKADAAVENARWTRQKRARWGLAALLGLVTLSAAIAFFFIGRGTEPTVPEEPPTASAPSVMDSASSTTRAGDSVGEPTLPSEPTAALPTEEGGDDTAAAAPDASGAAPEAGNGSDEPPVGAASAGPAQEPPAAPDAPGNGSMGESGMIPTPAAPPPASRASPSAPAQGTKAPVVGKVPAKPGTGVVRAQLASRVVGREPVDTLQSPVNVSAGGRNVYYFNEFRNLSGQTVTHRWEHNGQVMATIPFKIDGNRWRVYSIKRVDDDQRGAWRVTTVDKGGAVLARADFRVE